MSSRHEASAPERNVLRGNRSSGDQVANTDGQERDGTDSIQSSSAKEIDVNNSHYLQACAEACIIILGGSSKTQNNAGMRMYE